MKITYRLMVWFFAWGAMASAVWATGMAIDSPSLKWALLAVTSLGYLFTYSVGENKRRNFGVTALATVVVLLVFGYHVWLLSKDILSFGSTFAQLLGWMLSLYSFFLFNLEDQRRVLRWMIHPLVLFGATASYSLSFLMVLLTYLMCLVGFHFLNKNSSYLSDIPLPRIRLNLVRVAVVMLVVIGTATAVFGFTPGIKKINLQFDVLRRVKLGNETRQGPQDIGDQYQQAIDDNLFPAAVGSWVGWDDDFIISQGKNIRPNQAIVMEIKASRPFYVRGKVFHYYNDGAWKEGETKLREDIVFNRRNEARPGAGQTRDVAPFKLSRRWLNDHQMSNLVHIPLEDEALALDQRYTIKHHLDTSTIFHAYRPWKIYFPDESLITNEHLTVSASRQSLNKDTEYSVVSKYYEPEQAQLAAAGPPAINDSLRPYTQVPEALQESFSELAAELAEGKETYLERILAIQDYLMNNPEFSYTLEVPGQPMLEGVVPRDPVEFFVFTSKAGHCELFATACALLLRSAEVPCRVVTGFKPGRYNAVQNRYEVRDDDAHAWVEVYFDNSGWVVFDPTPASSAVVGKVVNDSMWQRFVGAIEEFFVYDTYGFWELRLKPFLRSVQGWLRSWAADPVGTWDSQPVWFRVGIPALLILLLAGWIVKQIFYAVRAIKNAPTAAEQRRLALIGRYHSLTKMLRRANAPISANMTPTETARVMLRRRPLLKERISLGFSRLQDAAYGPREIGDREFKEGDSAFGDLLNSLKGRKGPKKRR